MANSADPDQKPTDLDLHCLQNRVYPGSAGQGLSLKDLLESELTSLYSHILICSNEKSNTLHNEIFTVKHFLIDCI